MGFEGALEEFGLPPSSYSASLLVFNLWAELEQINVITAAWFLLAIWFGIKPCYRKFIVIPLSILICAVAAYWVVELLFV
jgi:hypothetical protein